MNYRITVKPSAEKELEKIENKDRKRILEALWHLSADPFLGKKLAGEYHGYYSLRVWPYRIIYTVLRKKLLVVVIKIGHRQGVYS